MAFTYVSDSSAKLADDLIATVRELHNGSDALAIQADMGSLDSPDRIVGACVSAFGNTIDILVNNAAAGGPTPVTPPNTTTLEAWDANINVSLRGAFFMTQAVVPHLPKAGGGRIINVGSTTARRVTASLAAYAAAKAGLEAFSRVWAVELGRIGHTANTVTPGPTETDMLATGMQTPEVRKDYEDAARGTPMEARFGTAEDVALVITALAEPGMRWVTGQTISASGGFTMV